MEEFLSIYDLWSYLFSHLTFSEQMGLARVNKKLRHHVSWFYMDSYLELTARRSITVSSILSCPSHDAINSDDRNNDDGKQKVIVTSDFTQVIFSLIPPAGFPCWSLFFNLISKEELLREMVDRFYSSEVRGVRKFTVGTMSSASQELWKDGGGQQLKSDVAPANKEHRKPAIIRAGHCGVILYIPSNFLPQLGASSEDKKQQKRKMEDEEDISPFSSSVRRVVFHPASHRQQGDKSTSGEKEERIAVKAGSSSLLFSITSNVVEKVVEECEAFRAQSSQPQIDFHTTDQKKIMQNKNQQKKQEDRSFVAKLLLGGMLARHAVFYYNHQSEEGEEERNEDSAENNTTITQKSFLSQNEALCKWLVAKIENKNDDENGGSTHILFESLETKLLLHALLSSYEIETSEYGDFFPSYDSAQIASSNPRLSQYHSRGFEDFNEKRGPSPTNSSPMLQYKHCIGYTLSCYKSSWNDDGGSEARGSSSIGGEIVDFTRRRVMCEKTKLAARVPLLIASESRLKVPPSVCGRNIYFFPPMNCTIEQWRKYAPLQSGSLNDPLIRADLEKKNVKWNEKKEEQKKEDEDEENDSNPFLYPVIIEDIWSLSTSLLGFHWMQRYQGNFLSNLNGLISVDLRGLWSLEVIEGDVLCRLPQLRNIIFGFSSTSSSLSLREIKGNFLTDCDVLESVQFYGLTELETIQKSFLVNCKNLKIVQLTSSLGEASSSFPNDDNSATESSNKTKERSSENNAVTSSSLLPKLKTIGGAFLTTLPSLQTLNIHLPRLEKVNKTFITALPQLQHLRFEYLPKLTSIGGHFLKDLKMLSEVHFDGLTALSRIDGSFFTECSHLHEANFSGLIQLQHVEGNMLFKCSELETANLTSLKKISNISPESASSSSITPNVYVNHHVGQSCPALSRVILPWHLQKLNFETKPQVIVREDSMGSVTWSGFSSSK